MSKNQTKQKSKKKPLAVVAICIGIILAIGAGALVVYSVAKDETLKEAALDIKEMVVPGSPADVATDNGEKPHDRFVYVDAQYFTYIDENGNEKLDVDAYMGEPSAETYAYEILEKADENGATIKAVKLSMTEAFYNDFQTRMRLSTQESFEALLNNPNLPNVSGISYDFAKNCTTVRYTIKNAETYDKLKDPVIPVIGLTACMFQTFTEEGLQGCDIKIVDTDGAEIARVHYPSGYNQ